MLTEGVSQRHQSKRKSTWCCLQTHAHGPMSALQYERTRRLDWYSFNMYIAKHTSPAPVAYYSNINEIMSDVSLVCLRH